MTFALNLVISASLIALCSWLSGKRPQLAGFLVSLPLTTLMVLAFSKAQYEDPQVSTRFARSILLGLVTSLGFFLPFLLAERTRLGFWPNYLLGLALLVASYFVHKSLFHSMLE